MKHLFILFFITFKLLYASDLEAIGLDGNTLLCSTNFFIFTTIVLLLMLFILFYVVRTNKLLRNNKDLFEALYDRSPFGLAVIDFETGAFINANTSIINSTGYTEEEFKNMTCWDITPKKYHNELKEQWITAKKKSSFGPYEKECYKKDGSTYPVEIIGFVIYNPSGKIIMWIFIKDLSEIKESQNRLKLAASVFAYAKEGICICDKNANIIDINEAFCAVTQYSKIQLIGQNPRILQSKKHGSEFYQQMWNSLLSRGFWTGEIWNKRKNGEIFAQILTISAVYDANEKLINYIALMTDITAIKNHQLELQGIAHCDLLTRLPNRLSIQESLYDNIIISSQKQTKLAVLFIDLDGFKAINDTHGHDTGDELLKIIATRMQSVLRQNDTIGRIGGDEFVGLLTDLIEIDEALPVVKRLLFSAKAPIYIKDLVLHVSASIGVSLYPDHGEDPDMLLRNSDHAMYQAKQRGKNKYIVFRAQE